VLNIPSGSTDLGPSATAAPVAVATPAQAEVLAALTASGPSTAAELGSRMGQHTNTVREHLDALVALGLTTRERESPAGRGRPAYRYAAVSASPEGAAYRVFLEALVEEFVATGPVERATERATELGRRASLTPTAKRVCRPAQLSPVGSHEIGYPATTFPGAS
jgi:predicted ArsR family transcriptional regulator